MKVLTIIFSAILIFCSCCQEELTGQKDEKPNIVLIFIDDQGYGDVGVYGATGFETPNIDQLAKEGMRFTNYYAAQPVCSVSRIGLLTGCYPNRLECPGALFPRDTIGINPDEWTIAEMLKEQGYNTACFGKWHLGRQKKFLPLQHGFDEFTGLPYSNDMWPNDIVTGELLDKNYPPLLPLIEGNEVIDRITSLQDQARLTTLYTEKAVDFINRNKEIPFFLYVPHTMAHVPLAVSEKFKGKSEQGLYGDVIMEIDWSVSQIIGAVEQNGLSDNTIFIFTTDNGPWLNFGNHAGSAGGLREGKMTNWDGGQRVPFVIRWPGKVPAGTICNKLACAIDLLPTFAAITNGRLSDNKIDGVDISPLWMGDFTASPRESVLYYQNDKLNAVRKGNWKLVLPHTWRSYDTAPGFDGRRGRRVTKSIDTPELYNMIRDPGEHYNVIESYPEKVDEIMLIVDETRQEFGDLNVGIERGRGTREMGH